MSYFIMTNKDKEKLSDPAVFEDDKIAELNAELKLKESDHRYVECDDTGKINTWSFRREFGIKNKPYKKGKKDSANEMPRQTAATYFLVVNNSGGGQGKAVFEAENTEKLHELMKGRQLNEMFVIIGRKAEVRLTIE